MARQRDRMPDPPQPVPVVGDGPEEFETDDVPPGTTGITPGGDGPEPLSEQVARLTGVKPPEPDIVVDAPPDPLTLAHREIARLNAEKAELQHRAAEAEQAFDAVVQPEALKARRLVAAPPAAGTGGNLPGVGPVTWVGRLPKDRTAPVIRFRGSESPAEAREDYLTHAGILGTEHPVEVVRQAG